MRCLSLVLLLAVSTACRSDISVTEQDRVMVLSPPLVDLRDVAVGETAEFEVQIASVSGGEIAIVDVDLFDNEGSGFEMVYPAPLTLFPGETVPLVFSFTPTTAGYHRTTLTVASTSEENQVQATFRARGVEPTASVWPGQLDLGPLAVGETATGSIKVRNDGVVDVQIDATDPAAPYLLDTSLPLTLVAGETSTLAVSITAETVDAVLSEIILSAGGVALGVVDLRVNACAGGAAVLYDQDGDGVTSCAGDCDDQDPSVLPGAREVFDGLDQDCDGIVDEGTEGYDDDGDGLSELEGDCSDGDPSVTPANDEVLGNFIDDDCDGVVDQGSEDKDADGYSPEGGDCDDNDPGVHVGATEVADGVDQDCDGLIDEQTAVFDDDGDGYCEHLVACSDGSLPGDCDDRSELAFERSPAASELANGVDDNCDGQVDEGTANADSDGDGYTPSGGDCDDSSAAVHPGRTEVVGTGVDEDCDGTAS